LLGHWIESSGIVKSGKKAGKKRGLKKLSPARPAKKRLGYQNGAQNVAK